ncbi:hypothetical protein H4219_001738 [Mycoemilia scoparia]|uniref:Cytosol aminopeptidase domain-containing protein n=1 Tax=Mycoemilia scoparia TaxID=417184 RepID=A0A9W8DRI2_9FUNG|nr:hypothetical protein H4219_001738 [Mycoemilia scoparia]
MSTLFSNSTRIRSSIAKLQAVSAGSLVRHSHTSSKGLIFGMYSNFEWSETEATKSNFTGSASEGQAISQNITEELKASGWKGKAGEARVVYTSLPSLGDNQKHHVAIVGLGEKQHQQQKDQNASSQFQEIIRKAVANGAKRLKERSVKDIDIDVIGYGHAEAEGAVLGLYSFDSLKSRDEDSPDPKNIALNSLGGSNANTAFLNTNPNALSWGTGLIYGQSQNLARDLATTPANLMTPSIFCQRACAELDSIPNVETNVYDAQWAEAHGMGAFLSVSQGSDEPLKFLEIKYTNAPKENGYIAWVGKGVTFDSGGISIKPSNGMELMKGDMGGAASVLSAFVGVAKLQLPINLVCCIPLCENLVNGKATKPGDVVRAMNGKTIEVINTDAEGRLILADALTYVTRRYKPNTTIDVATLTGAMDIALGGVYSGVFSASSKLWEQISMASTFTGDLSWRMPLHQIYGDMMKGTVSDLANIGGGRKAGACSAAMFLQNFVEMGQPDSSKATDPNNTSLEWAHMDIAGAMETSSSDGYDVKGMTGRPTRMLIEFARQRSLEKL